MTFTRITIQTARRMFSGGKEIILCPRKLRPGYPFSPHAFIYSPHWIDKRLNLWHDNYVHPAHHSLLVREAWDMMIREWEHFNASYEAGYYPSFWVETE